MKTKNEWLDDIEIRLKRALLDVMDLPEDEGKLFLQQELRSHLEDVSGEGIKLDYLNSLKERFPQIGSAVKPTNNAVSSDAASSEAAETVSREVDADEALAIVRRDWGQFSEEVRLEFIKEFMPEELASSGSEGADSGSTGAVIKNPSDELARFLKLPAESEISSERLQIALVSLLKTVSQVDALGTQVYKQVGLSRDLSSEDIRKLVGEYVGSTSVELKHLNQILDETRLKVGLIISSIADLSTSLSQSHLSKFQPSMIEQSVGSSGGGFLANNEAKCWKKYITLAEDIQPQKMEKAINDLIVKQLKKLKRR
jgi:hypothetical protein